MKKRLLTILVLAVLLVSIAALGGAFAEDNSYATVTSTNGYGVRLREGPSKNYAVKTKYSVGTIVTVLQRGTSWSQIQVGSTVGWMLNEFLEFGKGGSGSSSSSISYSGAYVTSGNGLRVWLRASAGGTRLQLYSPGTPVTILTYGSKWCHISIDGSVGYMMTQFIHFDTTPAAAKKVLGVSVNYLDPYPDDVLVATVNPEEATVTYSWTVDGVEYSTSSIQTVLNSFQGETIKVTVTGTGEYTGTASFTTNAVAADPWIKSVKLSSSSPIVGETLTAILNPSSADVEYSWRSNGIEVSTGASYTVQESDLGKLIQVKVTGLGTVLGSASDTASEPVATNKKLTGVTIDNTTPVVGTLLTATAEPSGLDVSYVWKVDGITVSNTATYIVQANDLGSLIEVTATALEPSTGVASASTQRVSAKTVTAVTLSTSTPVVGDTIEATVSPVDVTATYEWYLDDTLISGQTSSKLNVLDSYAEHTITVVALGSGVNGGRAESRPTNEVVSYPKIASVKLDHTSPVLGDTLTAEVTFDPEITDTAKRDAIVASLTYTWNVNTETAASTTDEYVVKSSDVGKQIRVVVKGTGDVQGVAASAYTSKVLSTTKLVSLKIYNVDTEANAGSEQPEVGHVLEAVVTPTQADGHVDYEWWVDKVKVSSTKYYIPTSDDVGKVITLLVRGNDDIYTGELTTTSKKVYQLTALDVDLNLAAPVRGITPQTSVKGYRINSEGEEVEIVSAKVQWGTYDGSTFTVSELDSYGTYLPGTQYDAKLTFTPADGYTLTDAIITINGDLIDVLSGRTGYYLSFPATESDMPITEYFITAVPAPVAGEKAVTSFSTDQYDASISWTKGVSSDRTFQTVEDYECTITLTPKTGYSTADLPENVFVVGGADSTAYTASGKSMVAKWHVDRDLTVETDVSVVTLDGSTDRLVICTASLDNYSGDLNNVVWAVSGDIVKSNTAITKTGGLLTIDKEETVGKELTVIATVEIDGKTYTGSKKITLSGGSVDQTISVVFEKVVKTVYAGDTGIQFKAYAVNSSKGVEYHLLADNVYASGTTIGLSTGTLNVDPDETAESLTVVASAKEDATVIAKWEVAVVHQAAEEDVLESVLAISPSTLSGIEATTAESVIIGRLPTSVGVTTSLGTVTALPITWTSNNYDETETNPATYTFEGQLTLPSNVHNDYGLDLNVKVKVITDLKGTEKIYKSAEAATAVTGVPNGTSVSDLPLPTAAKIHVEIDGVAATTVATVAWNTAEISGYDPAITDVAQTFVVKGTVILPDGYENPDDNSRATSCTVTVKEAAAANELTAIAWSDLPSTLTVDYGCDESDILALLPMDVTVTIDGTDTMFAHLTWTLSGYDATQEDQYVVTATPTMELPTGIKNTAALSLTGSSTSVTVKGRPAELVLSVGSFSETAYQGDETGFNVPVTVKNIGSVTATAVTPSVDGTGFSVSASAFTLTKGESYTFNVHVSPSSMEDGWHTCDVEVSYAGGYSATEYAFDAFDVDVIRKLEVKIISEPEVAKLYQGESITMTAIVVGGQGEVTFQWEGDPELNTDELTVTPSTTSAYKVVVTDAAGHTADDKLGITVSQGELSVSISGAPASPVTGGTSVTLSASASKGTGSYSYSWSNGEAGPSNTITLPAEAGTYTYTVTVSDGMDSASESVSITVE